MYKFQKINNIAGWAVFAISAFVFITTVEPTTGFWDCGEFISVSYKLEVPHPPGAPLFLMLGRLFSFLSLGDTTQVAFWINMLSVLASSFTILFMFWTITLIARKIIPVKEEEHRLANIMKVIGAATVGSLAFTFSDSFWFSAVEAEVYAMSSFFTAFVFWAIFKWERIDDEAAANRWIIFIFFIMGLSIGVHLLNLVTIPALGWVYYVKKYTKITVWGVVKATLASLLLIGVINGFIIPGLPSIAGSFDIFFVNTLGAPFGTGAALFMLMLTACIVYSIIWTQKNNKVIANTFILGFTFILIGYSSYTLILIRSNYNTPIDENNPENVVTFVSYLKREQYGSRPLFYGPYYTTNIIDQKKSDPIYEKTKNKYEIRGYKSKYVYDPREQTILPRMHSSIPKHRKLYENWANLKEGQKPTFTDNIGFMLRYQIGHMYLRYFLWNFSGRESDIQDAPSLSLIDAFKNVPESITNNKGRNNFFSIPLILGLVGLFFHFKADKKHFVTVATLFALTGAGLVFYLNSPPVEPRERDYIYVGSYYAFAFWIGFAVIAVASTLEKYIKNKTTATGIAFLLCFSAPLIMAAEGWDDHDRSNRYFSTDSAKNYLASCAPNAILFTGGDNDTFPLWYAQEVEGFRTDVRVIVLSYFNTDWYIEQMTRKAYKSDPLPFTLTNEHYRQSGPNDYVRYTENKKVNAVNIQTYIKLISQNHRVLQKLTRMGTMVNTLPTKKMYLKIDTADVLAKGIIPESKKDFLVDKMVWHLKGEGLEKKDLAIIDIIASNDWERPIYFNNTSLNGINMDLSNYIMQEGLAYRLLPVKKPNPKIEFVNTEIMYDNMMNNYFWRELDNPSVYYNEDYRNFVLNHRTCMNSLAKALIKEGKKDKAKEVLLANVKRMPHEAIPYDYSSPETAKLLSDLGEQELPLNMVNDIMNISESSLNYYVSEDLNYGYEHQKYLMMMQRGVFFYRQKNMVEESQAWEEKFTDLYAKIQP